MTSDGNLIVASNRLPYRAEHSGGEWKLVASPGGLVSALSGLRDARSFRWIGWPGSEIPKKERREVMQLMEREGNCLPVFLTHKEIDDYYNGFSNQVLWPLFHYLPNHMSFEESFWTGYEQVNRKFADAILEIAQPGDTVWIHDFHLMLLPSLLRAAQPKLRIGFFLHIPFPSSEIYRLLAMRKRILKGVLGADLIGFHSYDYLRHFASACLRLLGYESTPNAILAEERKINLGVFPIGIDPDQFAIGLKSSECRAHRRQLEEAFAGRKIILGVDRMDYTKGIPLKLRSFERFLEKYPKWRSKVVLYQVAVPTRGDVEAYQNLKEEVDELVGRINGRFGSLELSPLYYLNRSVPFEHLCALYASADIALLTPIRDGMNLVALEYLLCSAERHGILIQSEFIGAAHSLSGGIIVNPWNREEVVAAIEQALTMSESERRHRNAPMYHFLKTNTSRRWGELFIEELAQIKPEQENLPIRLAAQPLNVARKDLQMDYQRSKHRLLFFDYDGTVTPIRETPAEAVPDKKLLTILKRLGDDPRNHVFLVSGRPRQVLEEWFDRLPLHLCAEHGFAHRPPNHSHWQLIADVDLSWKGKVKEVLEYFRERTPGTIIEDKASSLTWHYRKAEPDFGKWQAQELLMHLEEVLSRIPAEVLQGDKVIEIRPQGINKGRFVKEMLQTNPETDFILCCGDDRTDEDMYRAVPTTAWTCQVGTHPTSARYYVESSKNVINLLSGLAD